LESSTPKATLPVEDLLERIARLSEKNRSDRSAEVERRILALRHRAGAALSEQTTVVPDYAEPALEELPERVGSELPEFGPSDLSLELVRAAILRDGCILVRGLVDADEATRLAGEIDGAFEARRTRASGGEPPGAYDEEFVP
jgi:hypothetical protein